MLQGDKVLLRAPDECDIDIFQEMRNDTDLQRTLLGIPKPNNRDDVNNWLKRFNGSNNAILFTIFSLADNAVVGFIQITQLDTLHGSGWLGVALHHDAQGKGFGREALSLLETYLKKTFNLRKVLLEVDAKNLARNFYSEHGYRDVGTMKQHFFHDGNYHDIHIMEKFI